MRIIHDHYEENKPKDVNVYMHDSGMVCHHDYACPVCSVNHAVLDLTNSIFQPCRNCQKQGWAIGKKVKSKNFIQRLFKC